MAEVLEGVTVGASGFARRVAIKRMLPTAIESASMSRMFLDEARVASHLHHANIVSVLDYGILDGVPFQVLELVDGLTAQMLIEPADASQPRLPPELALHICTEVGHALEHAHRATDDTGAPLGLVHRDVKPSNILVSWSGEVKLSDFGIAFSRNREEQTHDGFAKGTPLFMAPEQILRTRVDPRTDLFALGCVLHALLTGASPLAGGRLSLLLTGQTVPLPPQLDGDIAELLARAIHPEINERFPSASAMTRELGAALTRRVAVDPKSAMRDWLEKWRAPPEVKAPRAARWDGLFNLDIVPAEGEHAFKSLATRPVSVKSEAPTPRPEVAQVETRARPGRWAWPVGALTLVGIAAVGFAELGQRPARPVGRTQPSGASTPPALPLPSPELLPAGSPPPAVPSPTLASVVAHAEHHRTDSVDRRALPGTAHAPATPPESGVVALGGDGWVGAEVWLDGQRRGHAPKVMAVPVGRHAVDLVTVDGRHAGPDSVDVTARHTELSPLHFPAMLGQASHP
jgi:hypothetical protein